MKRSLAAVVFAMVVISVTLLVYFMRHEPTTSAVDTRLVDVAEKAGARLVFGGDVGLGRRQNAISADNPSAAFADLPELREAELAIVNLESVVTNQGRYGVEKGEYGPYYFRARPETLRVLTEHGVDIVQTANNHSGDYGPEALLEQLDFLDQAGIAHAGAGPTLDAACSPTFQRAGDIQVAFFGLDATMPFFAAGRDKPGTCFIDLANTQSWQRLLAPRINRARKRAHIVIVGVHWGDNWRDTPSELKRRVAKEIIIAGADAILGTSSHVLQGVEIIDGRPVIHDAGNLLFDFVQDQTAASGIFTLVLSRQGVSQLWFDPMRSRVGRIERASGSFRDEVLKSMTTRSRVLGSNPVLTTSHRLVWELTESALRPEPEESLPPRPAHFREPTATALPPADCVADEVPEEARLAPVRHGPLTLLGVRARPEKITRRNMVFVESWWQVNEPIRTDFWIRTQLAPVNGSKNQVWSGDHEPCDWRWPTSRFHSGVIYRDKYGVRPPGIGGLANGTLVVRTGVLEERKLLEDLTEGPTITVVITN